MGWREADDYAWAVEELRNSPALPTPEQLYKEMSSFTNSVTEACKMHYGSIRNFPKKWKRVLKESKDPIRAVYLHIQRKREDIRLYTYMAERERASQITAEDLAITITI